MNKIFVAAMTALFCSAVSPLGGAARSEVKDFGKGIFMLNEDWYGHQNSTINFLRPDESDEECWEYRIFRQANPGHELGCTSQFAALWNGRIYIISKQAKDPGASISGGRITVADARTMEMICQIELIDASGRTCDGRGFVGIDEHKAYVTTSNGAWILDLDRLEIKGQVSGTSNPFAGDGQTGPGALYLGQSGSAVLSDDASRVFIAHQQYGVLVVSAATDEVTAVIPFNDYDPETYPESSVGSVIKSRDGAIWASLTADRTGSGRALGALCRIDPVTLDKEYVEIPDGIYPPANSWYAWTADGFCASVSEDVLLWTGGKGSWFANKHVMEYDYVTRRFRVLIDLEHNDPDDPANGWQIYGAAMRPDPLTGNIYMALSRGFQNNTYQVRCYDAEGVFLRDYPLVAHYWFPALFLFPADNGSGPSGVGDISGFPDLRGDLYNLGGVLVCRDVSWGVWPAVASGIYIWHADERTRKVIIR